MADFSLRLRFEAGPAGLAMIERVWRKEVGVKILRDFDHILAYRNFPSIFIRQGVWRPLSPRYVARKIREGRPVDIWKYTTETFRSLTTPARLSAAGGRVRSRDVRVLRNDGSGVEAEWRVLPPAAGGRFAYANAVRPLMYLLDHVKVLLAEAAKRAIVRMLARHGYRGSVGARATET